MGFWFTQSGNKFDIHYFFQVFLIQACQAFECDTPAVQQEEHDMANACSSSDDYKQVVLTRPHSALLLSTVINGKAKRGAFTGAMAEQIRNADGRTDIHTIFNRAVLCMEMTNPDCKQQVPEFRSTLRKPLIPPRSLHAYKTKT